jgi:membrane protease YdiL (CAAX protease family)
MTAVVTSPQSAGTWARFGAFLRRTELPARSTGVRLSALPVLGKLFALDLLLMAALIATAATALALGLEMPAHVLDSVALTPALIALMLVGAPLGEEIVFRGWLSGRPGHVGAMLVLLATGIAFVLAGLFNPTPVNALIALAGIIAASVVLWRKRGRPPMAFFERHFRWFYFLSTFAFASVHLANFAEGNALILLPLTLPQLLLGLILGYVRVQFGLWAGVLLHAAHNSLFVGLLLAGAG